MTKQSSNGAGVGSIIDLLGGATAVAAHLRLTKWAIYKWPQIGYIPPRWHRSLLGLAQEKKVDLSVEDLWAATDKRDAG